jgi:hypothetical protein
MTLRRRLSSLAAAIAFLAVPASASAFSSLVTAPGSPFASGAGARSIATGDFDQDGKVDLAVVNETAPSLSIIPGTGNGGFGARTDYPLAGDPVAVTLGNLTGDVDPDLVVTNSSAGAATVFVGGAGVSFSPNAPTVVATGIVWSEIVNLDGDADNDLMVARESPGPAIAMLLNNGTGSFAPPTNAPVTAGNPRVVVPVDLNPDTFPDAVAITASGNIQLFQGGPGPSLNPQAPVALGAGTDPRGLAIADFDGDGSTDLAVTEHGINGVAVIPRTGLFTLGTPVQLTTNGPPRGLAARDLNADGDPDLVVATEAGRIDQFAGGAGMSFTLTSSLDAGAFSAPFGVASADFDADGLPDAAVTLAGSGQVLVALSSSPAVVAGAPSLAFGDQAVGTVSTAQRVTLTNNGDAGGRIDSLLTSGGQEDDFLTSHDTCPAELAPAASCSITVRFAPAALGARGTTLHVAGSYGTPIDVALTGTGTSGPAGPAGPGGPAGPAGPAGGTGAQGPTGPGGADGGTGAQGPSGPAGAAGGTGAQGPAGGTGAQGPAGPPGDDGHDAKVTCKVTRGKKAPKVSCKVKAVSAARAVLTRHGRVVARGRVRSGRLRLNARPGRYVLILRRGRLVIRQRILLR